MKVMAKKSLRITRIKAGFTLEMLADKAGMTRQAISQVERKINGIMPDKAIVICNALQVEFDQVFELSN